MELRPYQQAAIDATYEYLAAHDDGNPCAVIPTGGGKTPVLATFARDVVETGGRVMIVSHVRELLDQARNTLQAWAPELRGKIGIHSAGLRRRDTDHDCLIAGIQSAYRRACDIGPLDLIIVDEAHLIPQSGEGMYRQFLADAAVVNPDVRVVGLTATPYRLRSGMIVGDDQILSKIVYEASVRELIDAGYLCRLVSKEGEKVADTSSLHIRAGEFLDAEIDTAMREVLESACDEIIDLSAGRCGTLIFAPGVEYANEVAAYMRGRGIEIGAVFGGTPSTERDAIIRAFKSQRLRYVVNVNVLSTGFDATHIDCIAMLRPTMSPGLYYQQCGRGLRLHDGKADCLVLDFAGNVFRHGPIDDIRAVERNSGGIGNGAAPVKTCPECKEIVPIALPACFCGYVWPADEKPKHAPEASTAPILSTGITTDWCPVDRVQVSRWIKRDNPDAPPTLRIDYYTGLVDRVSEWVCIEHDGFAGDKARRWWQRRSEAPMPKTVSEAIRLIRLGALADTMAICVRSETGQYDTVQGYELADVPPWDVAESETTSDAIEPKYQPAPDDEIPF